MATESLTIDPAQPAKARVSNEIPMNDVRTSSTQRDQHLKGPDFLDIKQYPTAKLVSTAGKVAVTTAEITGNLTLHGVTKTNTLDAQLTGAGTPPSTEERHGGQKC